MDYIFKVKEYNKENKYSSCIAEYETEERAIYTAKCFWEHCTESEKKNIQINVDKFVFYSDGDYYIDRIWSIEDN